MEMEVVYTEEFERWMAGLRDRAKAAIISRIRRMERGNFGDRHSVGGGVSELRINVGPGYRVYYTIRRRILVVVLAGGDKSGQRRDIPLAQQLAQQV